MKLEKHIERLCSKYYSKDALLALLDYTMEGEENHYSLLHDIIKRYYENDKDFKNTSLIFMDSESREIFKALKGVMSVYASVGNNFSAVKDYPHLFDRDLKYYSGWVLESGRIAHEQTGAQATFFVGLPIYNYDYQRLGVLSYVCDDDGYYLWKILGYKGKQQRVKTYWQALKEGVIHE